MSRKDRLRRNLGGETSQDDPRFAEPFFDGPATAEMRTSIVLPERLLRQVLTDEVNRLAADRAELERFFSHFFDPTTSAAERDTYVDNFIASPPRTVIGYPRTTGEMPIFAIILQADEEQDNDGLIGNYVGQTLSGENPPGGEDQEYEGVFFSQVNAIHVYAQHPDQCLYLYHFAKLTLLGAREALHCAGLISPTYSGSELNPQEVYLPDNVFGRVLNVHYKVMMTVPKVFAYRDGRRLRLGGIFRTDIVVDGVRGTISTYEESGDGE